MIFRKNKKIKKYFFLLSLAVIFLFAVSPFLAGAASDYTYTSMEEIPGFGKASDFPTFLTNLYKFGLWAIGLAALLMITIGGFMYITSAGNNSQIGTAKGIITDAIIGIVMALTAYLLLYTINPDLTVFKGVSRVDTGTTDGGGAGGGGMVTTTASCSNLNSSLNGELSKAGNGVPAALLAAFMRRECTPAMSNPSACGSNNSYGAGGAMQFIDPTWSQYGCSGSKFNRQDAIRCAAKKISKDSGGDYSDAGIARAAKAYCGSCTNKNACGGDYCDGIIANYNVYKNCSI